MIRSKTLLQIGRRETGRLFLMFCLSPSLNIGTKFPLFLSSRNILHFKRFMNIAKRVSITDHIMTSSFVRIEFRDDSFNIILCKFSVCQVLICNGISWWGENRVIFNNWALFWKKGFKDICFFTKSCKKFVIMNNRQDVRSFLLFNIVFSNNQ